MSETRLGCPNVRLSDIHARKEVACAVSRPQCDSLSLSYSARYTLACDLCSASLRVGLLMGARPSASRELDAAPRCHLLCALLVKQPAAAASLFYALAVLRGTNACLHVHSILLLGVRTEENETFLQMKIRIDRKKLLFNSRWLYTHLIYK